MLLRVRRGRVRRIAVSHWDVDDDVGTSVAVTLQSGRTIYWRSRDKRVRCLAVLHEVVPLRVALPIIITSLAAAEALRLMHLLNGEGT